MGVLVFSEARIQTQTQLHNCTMPMIKFSYFDIEAKGELTRLLLHAGNFDFEDHRIPISEWPGEHKATTTFGQLPMLQWDGVELAQSMAIARFVARRAGLAGKTDLEFVQADMVACHYEDVWTKLPKMMFAKSQEERETLVKEYLGEFLPKWLEPLEKLLKNRGGEWFAGSSPLCRLRRHGGPRLPPLPQPRRLQGHRQPRREEEDVRVVPLGQGQLSEDKCSP